MLELHKKAYVVVGMMVLEDSRLARLQSRKRGTEPSVLVTSAEVPIEVESHAMVPSLPVEDKETLVQQGRMIFAVQYRKIAKAKRFVLGSRVMEIFLDGYVRDSKHEVTFPSSDGPCTRFGKSSSKWM